MSSLLLKKRKFTDLSEQPHGFPTPKLYLTSEGKAQKNYSVYFENFQLMFPDFPRHEIESEFQNANQDPLLTIERLKAKHDICQKLRQTSLNNSISEMPLLTQRRDQPFDETIRQLAKCQNEDSARFVLQELVAQIEHQNQRDRQKLEAENEVVKKAFKAQTKILVDFERKNKALSEEGEKAKRQNDYLLAKLRDADLASRNRFLSANNDVY